MKRILLALASVVVLPVGFIMPAAALFRRNGTQSEGIVGSHTHGAFLVVAGFVAFPCLIRHQVY